MLALEIGQRYNALYLDLESEQDLAKLAQPELYLQDRQDSLPGKAVAQDCASVR